MVFIWTASIGCVKGARGTEKQKKHLLKVFFIFTSHKTGLSKCLSMRTWVKQTMNHTILRWKSWLV